jgi:hypothetical protein
VSSADFDERAGGTDVDVGSERFGRRRRVRLAVALVALVGATFVAASIYHGTLGYWRRLETAVREFRIPADFDRLGKVREGTTFCVISCDEARITLVLRTTLAPNEACGRLRTAVERQIGRTETPGYLAGCGWEARLPDVGGDAFVLGGAERSDDFGENRPSWAYRAYKFSIPSDGTVAWVEFSSGID